MRGKGFYDMLRTLALRITPAYAGKSSVWTMLDVFV